MTRTGETRNGSQRGIKKLLRVMDKLIILIVMMVFMGVFISQNFSNHTLKIGVLYFMSITWFFKNGKNLFRPKKRHLLAKYSSGNANLPSLLKSYSSHLRIKKTEP